MSNRKRAGKKLTQKEIRRAVLSVTEKGFAQEIPGRGLVALRPKVEDVGSWSEALRTLSPAELALMNTLLTAEERGVRI